MAKNLLRLNVSELEQVKVLRASGSSYRAISREIGRDHKTVAAACRKPKMAAAIEDIKGALSDFFEGLARRMIASISDEDITKISAYQRTLSAAISVDKMQLLRGRSTENISLNLCEIVEAVERDGQEELRRERKKELAQEGAVPHPVS